MQSFTPARTAPVYSIFAVSGATALIYQVIWSRWLGLIFGNTTISVSLVLAAFMFGLAAGSWLAGRTLRRIDNPMRAYAFMELGIGIFAVCFPFLARITDSAFAAIISTETPLATSIAIRAVFAFILLLVPTTLMGTTLPLLTDAFRRSPRHTRTWKTGLLYAANTIGAALGIVLAGFFLIELIGVSATTLVAAMLNLLVAFVGFKLARRMQFPEQHPEGASGPLDAAGTLAVAALAASGALALASEVLWTRTVESLVGNSTYAFSMIVLLYLTGIAGGSWLMSLLVNRLRSHVPWLALLQLAMGIWVVIALSIHARIAGSLAPYRGTMVSLPFLFWQYFKVMLALVPLSALSGACFPIATRIIEPRNDDARGTLVAKAYAWNTLGAVAGSLVAGFIIAPRFDYLNALSLLAFFYLLLAAALCLAYYLLAQMPRRERVALAAISAVAVAMGSASLVAATRSDTFVAHFNKKYPNHEVVFHVQGLQGVTTVIRDKKQKLANRLLVNGIGMTTKVTDTKMMAHLPLLLHPDPQDTLVICFGMGTTYRSAITHGNNVTVVELVKEVFDAFDRFYDDAPRVRAYAKGRMVVNDGRNYLRLTKARYDVITIDPPPPIDAAGVNNLYSKEFIELAKSHLKPNGILAHWYPLPGSKSGVEDQETFNRLLLTFADVFPYVYVKTGYSKVGLHVLGSREPLEISKPILKRRMQDPAIAKDMQEWDTVRLGDVADLLVMTRHSTLANPVTDDHPLLEFYLLRTWQQHGMKMLAYNFW